MKIHHILCKKEKLNYKQKIKRMEKRSFLGSATVSGRRVSGYAIIWDSPSEIMFVSGRKCREVIKRSAVDENLLKRSDVKCYINHNPERMVARSNRGKGSLMLSIDNKGLRFEFEAPHTADGDYVVEMVKRGDLTGCSFAFYAIGESWSKDSSGIDIRTVTKINRLDDVSIVTSPAYQSTTLSVRNQNPLSDNYEKLERVETLYKNLNAKRQTEIAELEAEHHSFEDEIKRKREMLKRYKR